MSNKTKTTKKETAKKENTKKAEKEVKPEKERKMSITRALHKRFAEVGVENVKLEEALAIAKAIKPDTKFNSRHLAWHRNYYKELQANAQ
jgi:hypothetical protein